MTSLETVALDQERWRLTTDRLKFRNYIVFRRMVVLTLAGAVLEAIALQLHTLYPVVSEVAGYAGVVALALAVVMRARGFRSERVQAWVLAKAASQALKSEMYRYRTSSGPYSDHLDADPEATLLQRRDQILAKLSAVQKYAEEPDPKKVAQAKLGPLDADAYIEERVENEISTFRTYTQQLPKVQRAFLKFEYFLAIAGVLLAAVLGFTHNQSYGVWVVLIIALSLASGVNAMAERYAVLLVSFRSLPERLTRILARWRDNHGSLEQLVEQVEAAVLMEEQAWVAGVDEFLMDKDTARPPAKDPPQKLGLHSPASYTGA